MKQKIMVCVTRQKTCERLIKAGYDLASKSDAELHIVHVAKSGTNFLDNPSEGEALDYLFQISKKFNAEMSVLRSDQVANTIVKFVKDNDISTLILGETPHLDNKNNIIMQLKKQLPHVDIMVIPAYTNSNSKKNLKFNVLPTF